VPSNCSFEIDDAEDEWVFDTKFDFIHGRALVSCFSDPEFVLRQIYKSLAHGGYFELQDAVFPMEFIGEPPVNSALYKWNELVMEGARSQADRGLIPHTTQPGCMKLALK
jgi:SAM-dependent methyltransferase